MSSLRFHVHVLVRLFQAVSVFRSVPALLPVPALGILTTSCKLTYLPSAAPVGLSVS